VVLNGTLENNNTTASTTPITAQATIYDANGNSHAWTISATADATTAGDWDVTVTDENGATIGTSTLSFNGAGYGTFTATGSYKGAQAVTLDLSTVTSVGASNSLSVSSTGLASEGYASGSLTSVTINTAGQVLLTYSNGQTKQLGAVAIADFNNPQKLTQITGGFFENNTGQQAELGASGANQNGTLVSQQVEASNVNLSEEFGDLILIQRGFQASSEVLSTANDMIQQLFGVRGQG
jgi:flagellar hook protein FlgE